MGAGRALTRSATGGTVPLTPLSLVLSRSTEVVAFNRAGGSRQHAVQEGLPKVSRDLTERRAAEEELGMSEERFRRLVHRVTDYAIYMLESACRELIVAAWV